LTPHVVNKWKSGAASYTFKYNHECIERVRDQNHSTANNGFKHVPLNKLNSCKLPAYQGLKMVCHTVSRLLQRFSYSVFAWVYVVKTNGIIYVFCTKFGAISYAVISPKSWIGKDCRERQLCIGRCGLVAHI